ncbi:predicted ABC transporter permease component [Roseburia sp. CAG:309]|nr:predicted ABC transporter permease component [Roseburia sp. CAG:309]
MAEMRSFIGKHGLKLLLTISVTFLLVFMILPILDMFTKSVVDDNGFTWSYFKEFFSKSLYAKILLNTIRLSLIIGLVSIVLGYPVAYLMNRVGPVLRCIIMGCVQIPFWTSLLVRTYSWIAILQNQGVVNVVLQKLGIIKQPIQLLYNDAGVIIVMTYIMLPYMIFSISSVMGQIDKNVIIASRSLGAGKTMTFFRIFLPLSLPGIMSGFFIVFLNTMGYYIVPALVGGQKSQMFSQTIQNELSGVLNWNFASAISIILVMVTMMIVLASKAATKQKYAEV